MTTRYYHAIPNSVVHLCVAEGQVRTLTFFGGYLDVEDSDKLAKEHLDAVADKPGTMISTEKARATQSAELEAAAKQNTERAAQVVAAVAASKK